MTILPDAAFLPALPRRVPTAGEMSSRVSPAFLSGDDTMTPKTLILDFIAALALFTIIAGLPLILWGLQ